MELTATALQIPVFREVKENFECLSDQLMIHKDSDWIVTPEGALSGYCQAPNFQSTPQDIEQFNTYLGVLENMIYKEQISVALGTSYLEKEDSLPYNQVRIYKKGKFVTAYSKQMLTHAEDDAGEMRFFAPGRGMKYFTLDQYDQVKASALICNDVWAFPPVSQHGNPYYYKTAHDQGCRVMFVSANCSIDYKDPIVYSYHESTLQIMSRSYNMYTVVSGSSLSMSGEEVQHTQVPTGIIAPSGQWVLRANKVGLQHATQRIKL